MMDKHTAGPWYITASGPYECDCCTVYGADHTVIVPHYPIGYTEEKWANGRLTASAPELLEALVAYDEFSKSNDDWRELTDDGDVPTFVIKARQAIAKAKGE